MRAAAFHAVVVLALTLISCGRKAAQETTAPWFQDVASGSGINFIHQPGATGQFYMPEIMGSGAALLDYDGDGDLDVLLLQAGRGSRLYRNELIPSGKLQFTDVTPQAGFDYAGYGMGVHRRFRQ
jgi:enediyne biosynthesis protein E4